MWWSHMCWKRMIGVRYTIEESVKMLEGVNIHVWHRSIWMSQAESNMTPWWLLHRQLGHIWPPSGWEVPHTSPCIDLWIHRTQWFKAHGISKANMAEYIWHVGMTHIHVPLINKLFLVGLLARFMKSGYSVCPDVSVTRVVFSAIFSQKVM